MKKKMLPKKLSTEIGGVRFNGFKICNTIMIKPINKWMLIWFNVCTVYVRASVCVCSSGILFRVIFMLKVCQKIRSFSSILYQTSTDYSPCSRSTRLSWMGEDPLPHPYGIFNLNKNGFYCQKTCILYPPVFY